MGDLYFIDDFKNELYFYDDDSQFYFYNYKGDNSYLKYLFILAPRIPFISKDNISYQGYLPVYLVKNPLQSATIEFLTIIFKNIYKIKQKYTYKKDSIISNNGTIILKPNVKGFQTIKYNNITLERI